MTNEFFFRVAAIESCRKLASQYVDGTIDWLTFWEQLPNNFELFDPLGSSLDGLSKNQQREILFYFKWYGGEFGEHDHLIPRKRDWHYGKSDEPHGWVDRERYLKEFSDAFRQLKQSLGI